MSEFFSVLSGLAMIGVVVFYFRQITKGQSTPNPATWIISLVVMIINTLTYYFVSQKNVWLILTPSTIILGIVLIIIYSSIVGKLGKIGVVEIIAFLLAIAVGLFWQITKNSVVSNLMMQAIFIIGVIPTVIGVAKGNLKESPVSWTIAVVSYLFLIASILSRSEWTWAQLGYPIINGIFGNASVVVIAILKNKK